MIKPDNNIDTIRDSGERDGGEGKYDTRQEGNSIGEWEGILKRRLSQHCSSNSVKNHHKTVWFANWKLCFGAGLSILDMVTDINAIRVMLVTVGLENNGYFL